MEISKAYNPSSLSLTNLVRARYSSSGRIAVPVKRSHLIYSRLKHVSGVPAVSRQNGYSITLLRRLDNLIDSLIGMGKARAFTRDVTGLSEGELSSMVQRYEADLHAATVKSPSVHQGAVLRVQLNTLV